MFTEIVVNGSVLQLELDPGARLVDVLRAHALTGTKDACSSGACGACTVLIDGRAVLACLTLAARVTGEVLTVEGLTGSTEALRSAFATLGGVQCGYCASGQIVTACGFATSLEALEGGVTACDFDGNLCRCRGVGPGPAAMNVAATA